MLPLVQRNGKLAPGVLVSLLLPTPITISSDIKFSVSPGFRGREETGFLNYYPDSFSGLGHISLKVILTLSLTLQVSSF